jgi:hypothetical protein
MISTGAGFSSLALGNNSLHQRLGNAFEMLNFDSGVLFVQIGLHALINDRIRWTPDDHCAFFLCGVVKLRDRFVAALGFVLSVGTATEQQRQRAYNAN